MATIVDFDPLLVEERRKKREEKRHRRERGGEISLLILPQERVHKKSYTKVAVGTKSSQKPTSCIGEKKIGLKKL